MSESTECPLCHFKGGHAHGCPNAFLEGLPEPPKLPKDLTEQLAAGTAAYDQHGQALVAWAEMARIFYEALLREFNNAAIARDLLMQWEQIWFTHLYIQSTGGIDDGPTSEDR